jgi:PTH2 family peptidyl-tRNA hydrolase
MEPKQVIVIRKDLNMRKGKMIAQGSHASMKVFFDRAFIKPFIAADISLTPAMLEWLKGKFTKIVVGVNSETELLEIYNEAKKLELPCSLIQDCGLTEFNNIPTYTAVAIGPDYGEKIDLITGNLPLL